jgi:hypothetical protein
MGRGCWIRKSVKSGCPGGVLIMAFNIVDVTKSSSDLKIDGITVTSGASEESEEIDRGEDVFVETVMLLLHIASWDSAPDSGGYFTAYIAPLDDREGDLYDDVTGRAIINTNENSAYYAKVPLTWPAGCQYAQLVIENNAGVDTGTNAVSAIMKWQAITT